MPSIIEIITAAIDATAAAMPLAPPHPRERRFIARLHKAGAVGGSRNP
jgi:hypothetical protein